MVHLLEILLFVQDFKITKRQLTMNFHLDLSVQIFCNLKLKDFKPIFSPLTC
jgi:hypothetical protein